MSAETKTVALFLSLIVVAAVLVGWAEYSALTVLFDRVGQALSAVPAGQR